jgi:hypothetical protein
MQMPHGTTAPAATPDRTIAVTATVWVPDIWSPHATCAYSWINPPSRSRRVTNPPRGGCDG